MKTDSQIIDKWLKGIKTDLAKAYEQTKASGAMIKSLKAFNNKKGYTTSAGVKGNDYSYWLENGRKPNKKKSHEDLVKWAYWATNKKLSGGGFIAKWVEDKRINYNAFGVAYNIAKNGIKVPNKYNKGKIVEDVLTDKKVNKLMTDLSYNEVLKIKSDIIKKLENGSK